MSRVLNAEGADNGLDVGVSLLTFGSYPNGCVYMEKWGILTPE